MKPPTTVEIAGHHYTGQQLEQWLSAKNAEKSTLQHRVTLMRALYQAAKQDPQILKPLGVCIPELERCLIQNLQWLKLGGLTTAFYDEMSREVNRMPSAHVSSQVVLGRRLSAFRKG